MKSIDKVGITNGGAIQHSFTTEQVNSSPATKVEEPEISRPRIQDIIEIGKSLPNHATYANNEHGVKRSPELEEKETAYTTSGIPKEFLAKATLLNNTDNPITSGAKIQILTEFIKMHNNGEKLVNDVLSELEKYINTHPTPWPNINLPILLETILILVENGRTTNIESRLLSLTDKLDPKLPPATTELLSKVLLRPEIALDAKNVEKIVNYYKSTIGDLRRHGKESEWQLRLERILEITTKASTEGEKTKLQELVKEIFCLSRDSRILEQSLNFIDLNTSELMRSIKLELERQTDQLVQQKKEDIDRRNLEDKKQELFKIQSEIRSSFISNLGGGDCGVYAIRDMLKTIDHEKGDIPNDDIRNKICEKVIALAELESLQPSVGQELNVDSVKLKYKAIFNKNFELFCAVACSYYDTAINSQCSKHETKESLERNRALIQQSQGWDAVNNWDSIYSTVSTCGIIYNFIIADHKILYPDLLIENHGQYKQHASMDGIWLNNHEISAFLLSHGYVFKFKGDLDFNGCVLVYEHAQTKQKICLHNDGVDIGKGSGSGSHWQALKLSDISIIEKYAELKLAVDKPYHKVLSSTKNNKFSLLEKFIINLSSKPTGELLSESSDQQDTISAIFQVCTSSNNSAVVVKALEIANKLNKDDLDSSYIDKVLSTTANKDTIIELLYKQRNLKHTDNVDKFLLDQLINNESDKIRELSLSLLRGANLEDTIYGRAVRLEDSINVHADKLDSSDESIFALMESIANRGEKLTYNAFKLLQGIIPDEDALLQINKVIDHNKQLLPTSLIDKLCEQIKAGLVKDELVDIVTKLGQQGLSISAEKVMDACLSIIDNEKSSQEAKGKATSCVHLLNLRQNLNISEKDLQVLVDNLKVSKNITSQSLLLEIVENYVQSKKKLPDQLITILEQFVKDSKNFATYNMVIVLLKNLMSDDRYKLSVEAKRLVDLEYNGGKPDCSLVIQEIDTLIKKGILAHNSLFYLCKGLSNNNITAEEQQSVVALLRGILTHDSISTIPSYILQPLVMVLYNNMDKEVRNNVVILLNDINSSDKVKEEEKLLINEIIKYDNYSKIITNSEQSVDEKCAIANQLLLQVKAGKSLTFNNLQALNEVLHGEYDDKLKLVVGDIFLNASKYKFINNYIFIDNLPKQSKEIQLKLINVLEESAKYGEVISKPWIEQLEILISDANLTNNIIRLLGFAQENTLLKKPTLGFLISTLNAGEDGDVCLNIVDILASQIHYILSQSDQIRPDSLFLKEEIEALEKAALSKTSEISLTAFRALNDLAQDGIHLSEGLLSKYQEKLVNNLDQGIAQKLKPILDQKLNNIDLKLKYVVLNFLSNTESVYPEILQQEKVEDWITKSLIQDIVKQALDTNDELSVELFLERVDVLKEYYKDKPKVIEDILFSLRTKQLTEQLSLTDIATAIDFVQTSNCQKALTILNNSSNWRTELRIEWLTDQSTALNIVYVDDQVTELGYLLARLNWNKDLTDEFFKKIEGGNISSFTEVKDFLEFLIHNKVGQIYVDNAFRINSLLFDNQSIIKTWKYYIGSNLVEQDITKVFSNKIELIHDKLSELLKNNCSYESVKNLLNFIQERGHLNIEEHFINVLNIIYEYNLQNDICDKGFNILKLSELQFWEKGIHNLAIKETFKGGQERSLDELIDLIDKKTNGIELVSNKAAFKEKYNNIISSYEGRSKVLAEKEEIIKKWTRDDIEKWAAEVRRKSELAARVTQDEMVAVIKRAVEIHNNFAPRTIQLLSLIILLNPRENKGRLAQINTGEGKSTIVAMFAAIKALQGNKVDVITTSTELSIPEVQKQKEFFTMFGLTAGENSNFSTNKKAVYQQDIVYGTAGDFQGDILRTEYLGKDIRGNRGFGIAIVDEVDSMLIDGRSNSIQLSGSMPAMNHLEIALATIWSYIGDIERRLVTGLKGMEEQTFYITEDFKVENGEITILSGKNLEECIISVKDKQKFIEEHTKTHLEKLLRNLTQQEQEEWETFKTVELKTSNLQDEVADLEVVKKRNEKIGKLQDIRDKLTELDYQIRLEDIEKQHPQHEKEKELQGIFDQDMPSLQWNQKQRYPVLEIPKHLQSFALAHIPHWIESALTAKYTYKINRQYGVENNRITPIDYSNTGVLHDNMVWSDGLCQFLQIKEGLKITPENLSTNFISNVEFFKRYKSNIYGLTGTLGSQESQQLLAEVYNTDTVVIPPHKDNEIIGNLHSNYICKELPAIIINDKKQWYETICNSTLSKVRNKRGVLIICKYVDEVNQLEQLLKERYDSNKIFTYTGQGNFEKKEIEAGEIIIATNIAGRGTDIKTSDMIEENGGLHVCVTFLPDNLRVELQNVGRTSREGHNGTAQLIIFDENNDNIDLLRSYRDEKEVKAIEKARQDISRMLLRDELFKKFCQLQQEIFPDFKNSTFERKGLEERWAIWLRGVGDEINKANNQTELDEVRNKFDSFSSSIRSSDKIIDNPYYHVLKGNKLLEKEQYEEAISEYDKAIKLNPNFSLNAYYNKACAILKNNGDKNSQRAAKEELEKAKELIKKHYHPNIISFHTLINLGSSNPQISQQIQHQMNILGQQESYIDAALDVIEKASKKGWNAKIELTQLDKIFEGSETNHTSEIAEAEVNGLSHLFQLTEQKPTPWCDIIGVALIGLGQILAGAAITVFSGGAASQFGMGLISEGVSDLITAVKSGIDGNFSWKEWGIQKAISIAISCVTAGLGAIKAAAKSAGTFVKTAATKAKDIVLNAGKAIAGNATKQVVGESTKVGLKLAVKQVGLTLAKGVAKEAINQLVYYVADKTLLRLIEEEITAKVKAAISHMLENNEIIQNALKLDQENKNNYWQNKLIQEGLAIINPENNKWMDAIGSLATGIASAKIKGAGKVLQVKEMTTAVTTLANFTDDFIKQFEATLDRHKAKISKWITDIEQNKKVIASKVKLEDKGDNISDKGSHEITEAPKIQVGNEDVPEVDIRSQFSYNSKQNETPSAIDPKFYKPSKIEIIHSSFSHSITGQMMNTVKSKIVKTVTSGLVSAGVDTMAASAQKSISKDIESFQGARQIKFAQDKIAKGTDYINKPFEPSIDAPHISSDPQVNEMIEAVRGEGEGGLQHLGPLAKAAGRPIEIYDEKGKRIKTIGKVLGGQPIQLEYQKPSKGREQGHWKPLNGNELPSSGKNNCLFDAVSAYTGTPGPDLRKKTANELASNHRAYRNIMPAIQKLQQNGKSALYMGGVIMRGYWDVEDEDITSLIDVIKHQERPERPIFKKSHDSHLTHPEGTNLKYNHIIPANIIEEKLQKADPKKLRVQCSRFIAYPEIKQMLLEHRYAANAIENRSFEGGIALRQVLIWMPNNLVGGPEKNRGDDPDNKIDIPILNHQTKEYQELAKKALEAKPDDFLPLFMKLMEHKPNPVPWITKKNPEGITEWRVARASDLKASQLSEAQKGINIAPFSISGIASIFFEYTMEQIGDILAFRLRAEVNISGLTNTLILPGTYIFSEKSSNIHALLLYINLYFVALILHRNNQAMNIVSPLVILAPISLHGKHAVGVMFVAQEDGSGYKAFYLDPENTSIPAALASIFKENGYEIEQLVTEGQKYTNCGPEVIENFMLYLTGERLSQEDAIVNNSRLVEQELLSFGGAKEEANCLTLKDGYLKQNGVTVLFNAEGKSQASRDGYINNSTRYDIVTPQSIIDEVSVRAEPGTAPGNLLIELLSDYRINQDYAETILGEASSIDIS